MKVLTRSEVVTKLNQLKSGQKIRVGYQTCPPLKAAMKKAGWKVIKYTECNGLLGVDYETIPSVIDKKASGVVAAAPKTTYEWIIPHKLAYNSNTDKEYLRIAVEGINTETKSKFIVLNPSGEEVNDKDYKELIIPSYFSNKGTPSPVRNITIGNVISIEDKGERIDFG